MLIWKVVRYLAGDVRVDAVHERVEGGAHGALGAVGGVQLEGVEQHLVQVHVLHRACRLVRVVDQTLQHTKITGSSTHRVELMILFILPLQLTE